MGADRSVYYLFQQIRVVKLENGPTEEQVFEVAAQHGADDVIPLDDGSLEIITPVSSYNNVKVALDEANFSIESSDTIWDASTKVAIDLELATKLMKIINVLEDLDDVQHVYSNADISDDILAKL